MNKKLISIYLFLLLCLANHAEAATYRSSASNYSAGSSGTVTVSQTSVGVRNLVACWVSFSGAVTTITVSDGTTTFTSGTLVNTSSDTYGQWHYLLSSVASGSVTYTATYGASRTLRSIHCWEYTYTGIAAFDTQNTNSDSGGTGNVTTGNITTASTDEVVLGGVNNRFENGGFSTWAVNSVSADHHIETGDSGWRHSSWDRVLTGIMTNSNASVTSSASSWAAAVLAIKITDVPPHLKIKGRVKIRGMVKFR